MKEIQKPLLQDEKRDDTILQKFETFHYASSNFETLGYHSHDFYEIYLYISGKVRYCIEDMMYEPIPGDVLVIPPGYMHRPLVADSEVPYERMYLWIGESPLRELQTDSYPLVDLLKEFAAGKNYLIHFASDRFRILCDYYQQLILARERREGSSDLICRSYLTLLFVELCQAVAASNKKSSQLSRRELILDIIGFINEHLTENLTLDDISRQFGVSKYHLIREFKRHTETSVYAYVISKRIILAKKLLQEGYSPSKVCYLSGFNNYSNFYKSFLAETKLSPKDFALHTAY